MPVLAIDREITGEPRRVVWTREQIAQLRDAGLLHVQRYELIEGELIDKMRQNAPHASAIVRLQKAFIRLYEIDHMRVQLPLEVRLDDRSLNEPEPDFVITRGPNDDYAARHPQGHELTLLVEVSDSTARMDRIRKRRLYARAGVPEYWVLDLQKRQLFVYRTPQGDAYLEAKAYAEEESVEAPGTDGQIAVISILP
ncbi:MAG: Uma2 family endonuclease [Acidobacteria bacterium]|nr:Uma2 family endonuclease [Acidobacteriota bacterium]